MTDKSTQSLDELTDLPDAPDKPWWQSRAIIGALVVIVAQIARASGLEIDSQAMTDAIVSGITIIGAALAWWGRVRASRPISRRRIAPGVAVPARLRKPDGDATPARLPPDASRVGRRDPGPLDEHSG